MKNISGNTRSAFFKQMVSVKLNEILLVQSSWFLSSFFILSKSNSPSLQIFGLMHYVKKTFIKTKSIIAIFIYSNVRILPFLQVYWWQSLQGTSFHWYLSFAPSACTQSSPLKLFGWFLAQAVKFACPRSTQVKSPSVDKSFKPSHDFSPLWRCCR